MNDHPFETRVATVRHHLEPFDREADELLPTCQGRTFRGGVTADA